MFPECQEKAYEELVDMFPEAGDFEVTYGDTQDMVYLDLVINETMRVLAPAPQVARENTQDIQLSNGIVVPAGTQIIINMFALHRRKDIWGPDADMFNPENFLPSNMEGKHPYAYIPFTKGIRTCIGMCVTRIGKYMKNVIFLLLSGRKYGLISSKIALAKLLRNFKFSTDFKYQDLEFCSSLVLSLKHVPVLKIAKR